MTPAWHGAAGSRRADVTRPRRRRVTRSPSDGVPQRRAGVPPDCSCPRCQHDNPPQAKFCLECGAPPGAGLLRTAARSSPPPPSSASSAACSGSRPPAADGARFASPETYTPKHLAEKILTSKAALEGERKQVTVLFADLKGSMELLADRDPEEARKLLDPGARADDGGRPPLRGHGQPGDGRRDHGALRRAARPRGSRGAGVLRGAPDAGER